MTINKLKGVFIKELEGVYPKQEIESFFYLLTESYLGIKRIDIALDPKLEIDIDIEQKFHAVLANLKNEYPIQYIIGETEFYGLLFKVDKNVLIPRPETEELVDWIIGKVKSEKLEVRSKKLEVQNQNDNKFRLKILDIGTGSGCISIALAKNLPDSEVWAIDISEKALKVAKKNAEFNNVKINFLQSDILKCKKLMTKFDIIVSNPPYVRELEKKQMQNNVVKYEPQEALFVKNKDPLQFYKKIAELAKTGLNKNGELYFEINQEFSAETIELLEEKGFMNTEIKKDIYGADRMIKAQTK